MLSELNHWINITSMGVDVLLLLRILQLKLPRTYLFITLAAVLGVFFDAASLWLGPESRETIRLVFYSRYLYAFVYPAAAFDVWEEMKPQIVRIRRLAAMRLVMSLIFAALFGLIYTLVMGSDAESLAVINTFAVILWAAASTASFAFLWSLHRAVRSQKMSIPGNTGVWLLYFQLLLAAEACACFLVIVGQQFGPVLNNALDISLNLFSILITLWCVWKLRALASNVSSTPESASL